MKTNNNRIMKKYLILAAAAVVAMAACTKTTLDESATPDSPVTFQAANYSTQTKAGEVSVFGDFKTFQSRAFLHAEGINLNSDGTIKTPASFQEFFGTGAGETIKPYDSSDNDLSETALTTASTNVAYWAPSHNYYWPKSSVSYVNFIGWYGVGNGENNNPTISYTYTGETPKWTATLSWPFSNATIGATGTNLLYADMAWHYNNNPNAEYKQNGLASDYKGVPMLFHHALAQINLKAYVTKGDDPADAEAIVAGTTTGTVKDNTATWTIKLKDVVITPIYTEGTLNLTNIDPGTTGRNPWTGGWNVGSTAGNYTVAGPVAVDKVSKPEAAGTDGDVIAKTCVLPQSLASANLTFKLYIKTEYAGGTYNEEEISYTIPFTGGTTNLGTAEWVMNTKYTYFLKINPSQKTVLFDPAITEDWSTGTTTEQTI